MYTEHDYLAHHGVKGMRWGVRKERSSGPTDGSDEEAKKIGSSVGSINLKRRRR